jgi:hypothetical protein
MQFFNLAPQEQIIAGQSIMDNMTKGKVQKW